MKFSLALLGLLCMSVAVFGQRRQVENRQDPTIVGRDARKVDIEGGVAMAFSRSRKFPDGTLASDTIVVELRNRDFPEFGVGHFTRTVAGNDADSSPSRAANYFRIQIPALVYYTEGNNVAGFQRAAIGGGQNQDQIRLFLSLFNKNNGTGDGLNSAPFDPVNITRTQDGNGTLTVVRACRRDMVFCISVEFVTQRRTTQEGVRQRILVPDQTKISYFIDQDLINTNFPNRITADTKLAIISRIVWGSSERTATNDGSFVDNSGNNDAALAANPNAELDNDIEIRAGRFRGFFNFDRFVSVTYGNGTTADVRLKYVSFNKDGTQQQGFRNCAVGQLYLDENVAAITDINYDPSAGSYDAETSSFDSSSASSIIASFGAILMLLLATLA